MFDKNALNNRWIEVAAAWKECSLLNIKATEDYSFRECGHEGLKRKKNGERDRRYPCRVCLNETEKAVDESNMYYHEWHSIWELFESIGMSVKSRQEV